MSVTWRLELHFTCENIDYEPNCHRELLLDQQNAKTKKGMFAVAKKAGWIWQHEVLCPHCKTLFRPTLGKKGVNYG